MVQVGSLVRARRSAVRRYLATAALALPAGAVLGLATGMFFYSAGNPDWRANATASEAGSFILGFVWLGAVVGGGAAIGAVAGVLISRGGSRRQRIAYAGIGATALVLVAAVVCAFISFLFLFAGIPVAIIAGMLAALGASIAEPRIPHPRYG